jgi:hypothetical protein
MKTTVLYLLFTIVLFVYGPIRWNVPSHTKLVAFLLVYTVSFAAGYCFQMYRKKLADNGIMEELSNPGHPSFGLLGGTDVRCITFVFTMSCVYSILKHAVLMIHMFGSINFSALLNMNLATAYFDRISSNVQGTWYVQLINFTSVLDAFWYILGILYFKKLKLSYKFLFFVTTFERSSLFISKLSDSDSSQILQIRHDHNSKSLLASFTSFTSSRLNAVCRGITMSFIAP